MPAAGGSANQSGIYYQNAIAALYLARLCDTRRHRETDRAIAVRVEAPADVDDIVVTFADNHTAYIQAKEAVEAGSKEWRTLWRSLSRQSTAQSFRRDRDRLVLFSAKGTNLHQLKEACKRARSASDQAEWIAGLNKEQHRIIEAIEPLLDIGSLTGIESCALFGLIDIELVTIEQIERDWVPIWIPPSNKQPFTVFRLLRDRAGEAARYKRKFDAVALKSELSCENDVEFDASPELETLEAAVVACGSQLLQHKQTLGTTGKSLPRKTVGAIVQWALDPASSQKMSMLLDDAGMGKSAVAREIARILTDAGMCVLAIKADQQLSGITAYEQLEVALGLPEPVATVAGRIASVRHVLVVLDQVDALSLSLSRDQAALSVVLKLVADLRLVANVRVLVACRTFDKNSDPQLRSVDVDRTFSLEPFAEEDVRSFVSELGVDFAGLSPATRTLLRTPLHLDLFTRVVESSTETPAKCVAAHEITTLQDLYHALWNEVVLDPEPSAPPVDERVEVLRVVTDYMDEQQRTAVPDSVLRSHRHLQSATRWLLSEGVLLEGKRKVTLLHQTFFDFCFAKQFVEDGKKLSDVVRNGDQGLFVRSQIMQVLAFLRDADSGAYIKELFTLLTDETLRFHLRDLVMGWFGALSHPNDEDWTIAQRLIGMPELRTRCFRAMSGNPGWFDQMRKGSLAQLLHADDVVLDQEIVPFLSSIIDLRQHEVLTAVRPFLDSGERWNQRLGVLVSRVRVWQTDVAVEIFEWVFKANPAFRLNNRYQIEGLSAAFPQAGCRLFETVLVEVFENANQGRGVPFSLARELDSHLSSIDVRVLERLSTCVPLEFAHAVLSWLERILALQEVPQENRRFFPRDPLSQSWYDGLHGSTIELFRAFTNALALVAVQDADAFRRLTNRLAEMPWETSQRLLARAYAAAAERSARAALSFVVDDVRRLNLGDHENYESRRLIAAIIPFLESPERTQLEVFIIASPSTHVFRDKGGLRWAGLDHLYLLQAFPREMLSRTALRRLEELERKFPGVKAQEQPIGMISGMVDSPIPLDMARRMSDRNWLTAMVHYRGNARHARDPLKGGASELASALATVVKESPERFYNLAMRAPETIESAYVAAFINGLADSAAPAQRLFSVVRRFAHHLEGSLAIAISCALRKRAADGIPDDLMSALEAVVHRAPSEDADGSHRDAYTEYLNSESGSAFQAVMRGLDDREQTQPDHKWRLIEYAASSPSAGLRAGALEELCYVLPDDRNRAIDLFELLLDGFPHLLDSHFGTEFLYYGIYHHFQRLEPHIRALMDIGNGEKEQRGAELACIAAISARAMESHEALVRAQALAREALHGRASWRRGAARIYAHNIGGPEAEFCTGEVQQLLDDEDQQVRRFLGAAIHNLSVLQLPTSWDFVGAFARSRAIQEGFEAMSEYLLENGTVDPAGALSIVDDILSNLHLQGVTMYAGVDELIRAVLHIHLHALTNDQMKSFAMDLFDRLLDRFPSFAKQVLLEWDRR